VPTTLVCLSIDSIVSAAREQVSSELAGEVVILNLNAGVYHGLDATGSRVWQLIQQPRKVCEVRDLLVSEYAVEADRCERDLLELLEDLAHHGLLEVHAAAAS
jgi:Coenzyme PQQ synthesis protein D (PqqD)